jgi:hypothetical protein
LNGGSFGFFGNGSENQNGAVSSVIKTLASGVLFFSVTFETSVKSGSPISFPVRALEWATRRNPARPTLVIRAARGVFALAIAWISVAPAACARPAQPTQPSAARTDQSIPVNEGFRLAYGKEGTVTGTDLRIRFDTLLEDSRCATDVQCVWAGNARIVLRFEGDIRAGVKRDTLGVFLDPRMSTYGGYVIQFESLEPAPRSDRRPELRSYVAMLRVKPASS